MGFLRVYCYFPVFNNSGKGCALYGAYNPHRSSSSYNPHRSSSSYNPHRSSSSASLIKFGLLANEPVNCLFIPSTAPKLHRTAPLHTILVAAMATETLKSDAKSLVSMWRRREGHTGRRKLQNIRHFT